MSSVRHEYSCSFNRRGDSLGGAAHQLGLYGRRLTVSIAGAILWGVLHALAAVPVSFDFDVSIAGAILWGVLPTPTDRLNGRA